MYPQSPVQLVQVFFFFTSESLQLSCSLNYLFLVCLLFYLYIKCEKKFALFPARSLSCLSYLTFSSIVIVLFHFLLISLCYAILYCSQLPLFSFVAIAGPVTRPIPIFLYVSPQHPLLLSSMVPVLPFSHQYFFLTLKI